MEAKKSRFQGHSHACHLKMKKETHLFFTFKDKIQFLSQSSFTTLLFKILEESLLRDSERKQEREAKESLER